MLIAIPIKEDRGLDSETSPIFGRCPYFMFIDPDTKAYRVEENAAISAPGGAGIQAAQLVVNAHADAIISADLGPKAHAVISAAGITFFQFGGASVRDALEAFTQKQLPVLKHSSTDATRACSPESHQLR